MNSYISAIGTSTPKTKINQMEIAHFMADIFQMDDQERKKQEALYRASGIHSRYTALEDFAKSRGEFEFLPNNETMEPFPGVRDRMKLFRKEALDLSQKAIINCISTRPELRKDQITHLITVSCTGLYAPGLDIELVESLGLNNHIKRTGINYMGCYAAITAIRMADSICQADPQAVVLILCVELCTIHFQKEKDEDNILANALFSDGAGAVLMQSNPAPPISLKMENSYCDLAPEGKQDMVWGIGDLGFEMKLSTYVPEIIRSGISCLASNLLKSLSLKVEDIDFYAIHPGGKKILDVIEEELNICRKNNQPSREVLRDFGNMSSPTILFILKNIWNQLSDSDHEKTILSFAFGPGLTLESMLLRVKCK